MKKMKLNSLKSLTELQMQNVKGGSETIDFSYGAETNAPARKR